jgi:hypothetical protein
MAGEWTQAGDLDPISLPIIFGVIGCPLVVLPANVPNPSIVVPTPGSIPSQMALDFRQTLLRTGATRTFTVANPSLFPITLDWEYHHHVNDPAPASVASGPVQERSDPTTNALGVDIHNIHNIDGGHVEPSPEDTASSRDTLNPASSKEDEDTVEESLLRADNEPEVDVAAIFPLPESPSAPLTGNSDTSAPTGHTEDATTSAASPEEAVTGAPSEESLLAPISNGATAPLSVSPLDDATSAQPAELASERLDSEGAAPACPDRTTVDNADCPSHCNTSLLDAHSSPQGSVNVTLVPSGGGVKVHIDPVNHVADGPFRVFPPRATIPAGSQVTFRVTFQSDSVGAICGHFLGRPTLETGIDQAPDGDPLTNPRSPRGSSQGPVSNARCFSQKSNDDVTECYVTDKPQIVRTSPPAPMPPLRVDVRTQCIFPTLLFELPDSSAIASDGSELLLETHRGPDMCLVQGSATRDQPGPRGRMLVTNPTLCAIQFRVTTTPPFAAQVCHMAGAGTGTPVGTLVTQSDSPSHAWLTLPPGASVTVDVSAASCTGASSSSPEVGHHVGGNPCRRSDAHVTLDTGSLHVDFPIGPGRSFALRCVGASPVTVTSEHVF